MFNLQTVDRLMLGISAIVSENRSSLSEEEVALLKECITFLDTVKNADDPTSPVIMSIVASVIEILLRVLLCEDFNKLKDLFF
jgi:hypothetical protein